MTPAADDQGLPRRGRDRPEHRYDCTTCSWTSPSRSCPATCGWRLTSASWPTARFTAPSPARMCRPRSSAASRGRRGGRRLAPAQLTKIRSTSGRSARVLDEYAPDLRVSLSSRCRARDPRVRAHLDDDRQRLRPTSRGRVSRSSWASPVHELGIRAPVHDALVGRHRHRRDGSPLSRSAWSNRGPAAGALAAAYYGELSQAGLAALLRHGRHDRQGLPRSTTAGRRSRPSSRSIASTGSRRAAACRSGAGHRDDRDRRGRAARSPGWIRLGPAEGRAGQRGRRSWAGLLRPRRHAADRHRRRSAARLPGPGLLSRRSMGSISTAAERGDRGASWRPHGLDAARRPPGVSMQVVNEKWPARRASTPSSSGKDPRAYPVFAFGGAGPVHAYRVAEILGCAEVIVPLARASASTIGFLVAPWRSTSFAPIRRLASRRLDAASTRTSTRWRPRAAAILGEAGVPQADRISVRAQRRLRYVGQGHEVRVPLPDGDLDDSRRGEIEEQFAREYTRLYGRTPTGNPVEAMTWRLIARADDENRRELLGRARTRYVRDRADDAGNLSARESGDGGGAGVLPLFASGRIHLRRPVRDRGTGVDDHRWVACQRPNRQRSKHRSCHEGTGIGDPGLSKEALPA